MAPEQCLATVAAALVAGLIANIAQAAPIATSAIDLKVAMQEASYTDKIASRRCWWRNGQRHCVRVGGSRSLVYGSRSQGSDYYEHIPEKLPYGSSSWWDQMVRENRGGNPGGGGRR